MTRTKPRIVASIEARMGSSRLPGKVLMDIGGKPALHRLIQRLRKCKTLDEIVVATSKSATDDELEEWCKCNKIKCYRGSEEDVLDRVVQAHESVGSDLIVEITGDCPLTDPNIVDLGVETFLKNDTDVVTNCGSVLTWPMGQYVQVFPFRLLQQLNQSTTDPVVREHVSLFFYENPEKYKTINLIAPNQWRYPSWRLQLDYPEDLKFQNEIHLKLAPDFGDCFGIEETVAVLNKFPDLLKINAQCVEKSSR